MDTDDELAKPLHAKSHDQLHGSEQRVVSEDARTNARL
jgi:hypothetical protein